MSNLSQFSNMTIDWDMSPEDAVTMYLEWGNNNWKGAQGPVRSKADYSTYFVVNTWDGKPKIYLIKRNSETAEELAALDLPESLVGAFMHDVGGLKGVFEPTPEIKSWLKAQLEN